ncbi:MAG: hypothetical protein N4A45_07190 [Flavobacteriales bacterium]|jgi:hypothetical protein|nr:hypothetical protein [Flavobacteriales bacterium]
MKKIIQLTLFFGCISQLSLGQLTNLNFGLEAGTSTYSSKYFNGSTNLSRLPKADHPISNAVFAVHLRQQIASFMDLGAKYSISTIRDLNLNLSNVNGFESEFNSFHFGTRIYPDAFFWGNKEPFAHVFVGVGAYYGSHHITKFRATSLTDILEYDNKKSISGIFGLNYEAGIEVKLSKSAGLVFTHEWFNLNNIEFNDFLRKDESPNYKLSNFKIGLMFDLGGTSDNKIPIKKWNSTKTLRNKRIQIAQAEIERKKGKKIIIIKRKKNTGGDSPKYLVSSNDTIENVTIIDNSDQKEVHFEKPVMKSTMHQTVFTDDKETVVNTTELGNKEVSQAELRQYIADLVLSESSVDSVQNIQSNSTELAVNNTVKKENKKIDIKDFVRDNKPEINTTVVSEKNDREIRPQLIEERPIKNTSSKRKKGVDISQFLGLVKRKKKQTKQEPIEDISNTQESKISQESKSDSTYIASLANEVNNNRQNNITPVVSAEVSVESNKSLEIDTENLELKTKARKPSLKEEKVEIVLENGIKKSPIDVNKFVKKDPIYNQLTLDNSISQLNLKEPKSIVEETKNTKPIQKNESEKLADTQKQEITPIVEEVKNVEPIQKNDSEKLTDTRKQEITPIVEEVKNVEPIQKNDSEKLAITHNQKEHEETPRSIKNQSVNETSNVVQNTVQNFAASPVATIVKKPKNSVSSIEPKTEEEKTIIAETENNIISSTTNKEGKKEVINTSAETFDDNFMLHHPAQKSKKIVSNVSAPVDASLHEHAKKKKEKVQNEVTDSKEETSSKRKEQIIKTLKYSKDSHILNKGDQKKLKEIIVMLRKNPNKKIHLELLGKNPLNSKRMALLYTDFTIKNSIDESRIISQKYTTNSTKEDILKVIVLK